jgi:hypothetical protein
MADRTVLNSGYLQVLFTAENGFLEGNGKLGSLVSALLRTLASRCSSSAEEGIENVAEPAEVHTLEAPHPGVLYPGMTVAVIDRPFITIGEHFISLINFFESLTGVVVTVMVRVIFESQLPKSLLYFFIGSIPVYP